MKKHSKAPPRAGNIGEDDAEVAGELCIRFMEQVLEGVLVHEKLKSHYTDIYSLLSDVGQDILQSYAFDYAYHLYSDEHVIRSKRLAFEIEASKVDEKKDEA